LKQKISLDEHIKLQQQVNFLTYQVHKMKNEAVMQECCNKRLNLLVHGIEDSPWETREQTKDKLNQFFIDGLKLDPQNFCIYYT